VLYLSDITSQFHTVAMFVIVNIYKTVHTEFVCTSI